MDLKRKAEHIEPISYKGKLLTAQLCREITLKLYGGKTELERKTIISGVKTHYLENGGNRYGSDTSLTEQIKKMLRAMKNNDIAMTSSVGIYGFISREEPCLQEENDHDTDEDDTLQIEETKHGCVYVYTFPSLIENATLKGTKRLKYKIGSHNTTDPNDRIINQIGTAGFEKHHLECTFPTKDYRKLERVFHAILTLRGEHCNEGAGVEWFSTNRQEIDDIYRFITQTEL